MKLFTAAWVAMIVFATLLCGTGCSGHRRDTTGQPLPAPRLQAYHELESEQVLLRTPIDSRLPPSALARVRIRPGVLWNTTRLRTYVDDVARELGVEPKRVLVIDSEGFEHSQRLKDASGAFAVDDMRLWEYTQAKEARLLKRLQEQLDLEMPGQVRAQLNLVVDGWDHFRTTPDPDWRPPDLFRREAGPPPEVPGANVGPKVRRLELYVGLKVSKIVVLLVANGLSEQELAAATQLAQAAVSEESSQVVVEVDNRPWSADAPTLPPTNHSSKLAVAVVSLMVVIGVVGLWSGVLKRRRQISIS